MKKFISLAIMGILLNTLRAYAGCPDGMKPIPAGKFKMGFRDKEEKTGAFCMDIYEVTVSEFKAYKPDYEPHKFSTADNAPATYVTYAEAQGYCKNKGKRLPTQEEWEKACRGPKGWKYPYGNTFDATKCHTSKMAKKGTVDVGSHPECVSAYGIFDMAGNVLEWTKSPYEAKNNYYVIKSSAWTHSMTTSRCSTRFNRNRKDKFSNTGFRCVK